MWFYLRLYFCGFCLGLEQTGDWIVFDIIFLFCAILLLYFGAVIKMVINQVFCFM